MPVGLSTRLNHYGNALCPAAVSLRDLLRSDTRAAHERLDSLVKRLDLQMLADYRSFLKASAAALLPLETALADAGVSRIFPDWEQRSRSRAVLADLARVGGTLRLSHVTGRFGLEEIFGSMYVLEGSRLGARVLLRILEKSPDPRVAETTGYLTHGAGSPLWQSFLLKLERSAGWYDADAMTTAARRAFELFERNFSSPDC